MRVLYLVGTLGTGGLERFVTRISLRSKEAGDIDPVVCCLGERQGQFLPALERAGVPVYEAPEGWRRRRKPLQDLARLIRGVAPDLVHSQVNFSLFQQALAVRSGGRPAFCVTERNCYPLRGAARLRRILQFHALRHLGAHYSANAAAVAEHLSKQVFVPVSQIPVLPNGVPLVQPDPDVRARVRGQLGWGDHDVGVAYVARMAAHKGHESFLRALACLLREGIPVRAALLGDGPDRLALEELSRELGLEGCVSFAGRVRNVEEYLQGADVACLLSGHEGMSNALLEAMAAGKAIVATAVGAGPELLDDGRAGVVIRGSGPADLAAALRGVLCDPHLRRQLGEKAAERCGQLFTLDACYSRLLTHYREVVES